MNKNIILAALQSQLETVKADAIGHEEHVFNPAVEKLKAKITEWFATNVCDGLHNVEISSERLTITPNDTTSYGSTITIDYRGSWRGDGGYFETSSYRPDLKSSEDNTQTIFYFNAMAAVANSFSDICAKFKSSWMPAYGKLAAAKSDKYNEIYKIEREVRNCEQEIAVLEKEIYNQSGFECTLKDWADYNSTSVDNEYVYVKTLTPHNIKAHYGRGRWDYYYINSFKVISFPKAKHAKVVLEYKQSSNEKLYTAELSKQRYADFIADVYNWQTSKADSREADTNERVARYNKVDA
jgi:hypothetical protein